MQKKNRRPPRLWDNPVIKVWSEPGGFEKALRVFRNRLQNSGVLVDLRIRQENPSRRDRKRAKAQRALKRYKKLKQKEA